MSIRFFSEDVPLPAIPKRKIDQWIKTILFEEKKSAGEIVVVFCSDSYLLEMNKKYLNHDYFTDIITFDYVEDDIISGDLFISFDRISENATKYDVPLGKEINRVIVHGVLHLLGYSDKTEAEKESMRRREDECLNKFVN